MARSVTPSAPAAPRWRRRLALFIGGVSTIAACLAIRAYWPAPTASADPPAQRQPAAQRSPSAPRQLPADAAKRPPAKSAASDAVHAVPVDQPKRDVVAMVNNENVMRVELGKQCLRHHGEEVLERLVNKQLILDACKQQGITITNEEIEAEIDRMAQRFGIPTDQLLKLLEEERGIKARQYAQDIIWPTLALQKLAAPKLVVTEKELLEAHEMQYGEAIRARLIACKTREKAEEIRGLALKNPDSFGELAMEHSIDPNSASAKGLIQPIRRHMGLDDVEQAAFALDDGAISEVIQVGDQYVFLKSEGRFPARNVPLASVEKQLRDVIREKKLRTAADEVFKQLQDAARLDVVYSDPKRREQNPGIAARINDTTITLADLAEECIARHGREVLDGIVHRRLLEQECRRRKVQVTQQDVDREMAEAAKALGQIDPQTKQPDVAGWLKIVTEEQKIPVDLYIHEAVWPSVALKRLVEKNVEVTKQDLERGYEANYGPRVRCRAIVFDNLRRAQEVWEMARKDPSVANFSRLAEQFSIEASSRALAGEVPPIQKWGGQPHLEKEAFALAPGELSGIIQVGEQYVILLCEGYTKPVAANFDEVRDILQEDIFEKKLRLAMASEFERIRDTARVDNFLTNTSRRPSGAGERESVSLDTGVKPAAANQPRQGSAAGQAPAGAAPAAQPQPVKTPVRLSPPPVNRPAAK